MKAYIDGLLQLFPYDLAKQFVTETLKQEYDEGKDEVLVAPELKNLALARQIASMLDLPPKEQKRLAKAIAKIAGKPARDYIPAEPEQDEIDHEAKKVAALLMSWWIQALRFTRGEISKELPVRLDSNLLPVEFPSPLRVPGYTSWYNMLEHQLASYPLRDGQVQLLYKAFAENVKTEIDKHSDDLNPVDFVTVCKDERGYYLPSFA